jgi:hypothetical protein
MMECAENHSIQSTQFTTHLGAAYAQSKKYADPMCRTFRWLCALCEQLSKGRPHKLGTIANIDDNHWIAMVLDFEGDQIIYGDSLGGAPKHELCKVVKWWTTLHTGRDFTVMPLPIFPKVMVTHVVSLHGMHWWCIFFKRRCTICSTLNWLIMST